MSFSVRPVYNNVMIKPDAYKQMANGEIRYKFALAIFVLHNNSVILLDRCAQINTLLQNYNIIARVASVESVLAFRTNDNVCVSSL